MAIPKFSMKLHRRPLLLIYKNYKEPTCTQHALFSNLISKYLNIMLKRVVQNTLHRGLNTGLKQEF